MQIKINKASTYPLEYHFRDKRMVMKPLFDNLISKLAKEMDFEYKISKAYIGLMKTLVLPLI